MNSNDKTSHIGPITTKMFSKLQTIMQDADEASRYACLYNLLVMMKEKAVETKVEVEVEDDTDD